MSKSRVEDSAASRLRRLLNENKLLKVPCCHDAFSSRIAESVGFQAIFGSGFVISAAHGMPDTGLITLTEMVNTLKSMVSALPPNFILFGDGDTGFGNAMNVKRTVEEYARAGVACIMLEDQIFPKQCGHTVGKQVVSREESYAKIRAAVEAARKLREERNLDILIMARTDSRGPLGFEEAIRRCKAFREIGADITFLEAPLSIDELKLYAENVSGPKMCNMLAGGLTPSLSPKYLEEIGFSIAVYPFDLLISIIRAGTKTLQDLKESWDEPPPVYQTTDVDKLWQLTGFRKYENDQEQYDCLKFKQI